MGIMAYVERKYLTGQFEDLLHKEVEVNYGI